MRFKSAIYICFLLLFITYMAYANYIFTALIRVENESSRIFLDIPNTTSSDIKMSVDSIEQKRIKWKDMIVLDGWAFKINKKNEEINRYIVLHSDKVYYVFGIGDLIIRREDVAKGFNIDNYSTGFKVLIANDCIKEGVYRLGLIVEDDIGKHYFLSDKYLTKQNDKVNISGFLSTKMELTIKESGRTVRNYFDSIEDQDGIINIRGWGFLEDLDTNNIQHYLLFKKGNEINAFDTANKNTKDITEYFEDYGLDLDNARFEAGVPKDLLGKGKYQLGLYIEVGYEKGIVFVERFVEID